MVTSELIEAITAAVLQRGGRREGGEFRFRCPNGDAHAHGDLHPSARWNPAKAVWRCDACGAHGGAVNLARRLDVLPPTGGHGASGALRRTVYPIRDAVGTVIAEHVRDDLPNGEKRLWWRRDGKKGLGGLKVRDLPLYGAPELAAAPATATVVVVEGEKARDALAARGILAVATVTGAGAVPADDVLRLLVGHDVVLWPDNDAPGRIHMAKLGARVEALST
jgi:hypothetical protein